MQVWWWRALQAGGTLVSTSAGICSLYCLLCGLYATAQELLYIAETSDMMMKDITAASRDGTALQRYDPPVTWSIPQYMHLIRV